MQSILVFSKRFIPQHDENPSVGSVDKSKDETMTKCPKGPQTSGLNCLSLGGK